MTLIDLIEGILRGGAAAISVVMIAQILTPRPLSWPAIYGALFFAGAGIYAVVALPAIQAEAGLFNIPLKMVSLASPGFFWLFVRALYDDDYKFTLTDAMLPASLAGLFLVSVAVPPVMEYIVWMQLGIVAVLMGHTVHIVRSHLPGDLVASRRKVAGTLSWLIPLIAAAIIGVELVEIANVTSDGNGAPVWARLLVAGGILAVAALLMMSLSSLRKSLLPSPAAQPATDDEAPTGLSAADRIDLGRLRDLMEEGAYLSSGLTIGELAQSLNTPEHRLRKLINGALGYRNFAAFINDYRIAEAERRLAQPGMARAQITNLAYDVGFGSLAPFNRAFRSRTGMSPSQYREKALAQL